MFDALTGLVGDVVRVAAAPVEIAAGVARTVTKPVADLAEEAVDDAKDLLELDELFDT